MDKEILTNSIQENFLSVIAIADEKSKKINKASYDEGFKLLGADIFPQNTIPFTDNEIKKIGSDFITEWIVKNWSSLSEENRIIFLGKLIDQLQGNIKLSRRFSVLLCAKLSHLFVEDAIRLLGKICKQAKSSSSFPLNKELCLQIRSLLLNSHDILITKLPLRYSAPGVEDVPEYGLGAAFLESKTGKTANEKAQIQVLKWITESGIVLKVQDEIAELIQKSTLVTNEKIPKIQKFLPSFPDEIKWEKAVVEKQSEKPITKDVNIDSKKEGIIMQIQSIQQDKHGEHVDPLKGKDTTRQYKVEKTDPFDPINSLKQWQQYHCCPVNFFYYNITP